MTFDLPLPPTSNKLFADIIVKGRVRRITTREYKAWRKDAENALGVQYARYGAPTVLRPIAVTLRVNLSYIGDIMNREKAVTDLLCAVIDMPDDRYIERYVVERDRSVEGATVSIESGYVGEARPIGEIIKPIMARLAEGME